MAHSIRDHGNFLQVNSRYKPAFAYTRDANKFIWAVWKAGYATDPNYYTKVTGDHERPTRCTSTTPGSESEPRTEAR